MPTFKFYKKSKLIHDDLKGANEESLRKIVKNLSDNVH
jgi:hypothetical protein